MAMTEIRPGMSVHLVKMPERGENLAHHRIKPGDIGRVMRVGGADCETGKILYEVCFSGSVRTFWLSRDVIEPTSPAGVQIERPTMREAGFYWLRDDEGWHPAQWDVAFGRRWWILGCEIPYNDDEFDEIGPRIEMPEGLK